MKKNIEKISRRKFAKKISSTVLYTSSILGVSMFERSLYAELEKQKKLLPGILEKLAKELDCEVGYKILDYVKSSSIKTNN